MHTIVRLLLEECIDILSKLKSSLSTQSVFHILRSEVGVESGVLNFLTLEIESDFHKKGVRILRGNEGNADMMSGTGCRPTS